MAAEQGSLAEELGKKEGWEEGAMHKLQRCTGKSNRLSGTGTCSPTWFIDSPGPALARNNKPQPKHIPA